MPTYHGTTGVEQVLDAAGQDMSDGYLLDCCYMVDFVDGEVADLTQNLVNQYPHLQAVTEAFATNGINHWRDGVSSILPSRCVRKSSTSPRRMRTTRAN